jgi:transposase
MPDLQVHHQGCALLLSQWRTHLPWPIFEMILKEALGPKVEKANIRMHFVLARACKVWMEVFSLWPIAAFAKLGVVVLLELGIRNPLAAAVSVRQESEMVLTRQLLDKLPENSFLQIVWADGGYLGKLAQWVKQLRPPGKLKLEIVRRCNKTKGFKVLPKRWIVERTFGRLSKSRRLYRDYEVRLDHSEVMIRILHDSSYAQAPSQSVMILFLKLLTGLNLVRVFTFYLKNRNTQITLLDLSQWALSEMAR